MSNPPIVFVAQLGDRRTDAIVTRFFASNLGLNAKVSIHPFDAVAGYVANEPSPAGIFIAV